jgi:hypothetical protein
MIASGQSRHFRDVLNESAPWLAGIVLSYRALTPVVKRIYIYKFGKWL